MSVFINVSLMYSGIPVFQVFVSAHEKDQSVESTAMPALAVKKISSFPLFSGCYV